VKNLKVRSKLLAAFFLVTALTVVVGLVGLISLTTLNGDYQFAIDMHGKPLQNIGHAVADLHAVRAELRAAMLFTGDSDKVRLQRTLVQDFLTDFETQTDGLVDYFPREDAKALYLEAMDTYKDDFLPAVEKVLTDAERGVSQAELTAYMVATIKPAVDLAAENLSECMDIKSGMLDTTSAAGTDLANLMFVIQPVLLVAVALISVFLALYISGLISKPLLPLTSFLRRASSTGNIRLRPEDVQALSQYAGRKDELGQNLSAMGKFIERISEVGKELETVADGDLTASFAPLSAEDALGLSLQKMTENLNAMFGDIHASSGQVSSGSKQIADGAQALAQGSTEQAAAVEQLSASISEIAEKTKENAAMADKAAALSESIRQNAEKGSNQMGQMTQAVKEINDASQAISKVIKTIDDIAFQTNILALNAAVEAARAGQHGKGFAVVAEEVRSLASKSAAAAKDTAELIENSMEKAGLGAKIAGETAASLGEIVSGIHESSALVGDIAASSEEQSQGIAQINKGIDQVAQVVQQNSATAEQSAAAAQEMSGQSAMLEELIRQFKIKDSDARKPQLGSAQAVQALPQSGYGKY
jgi:methyl-accepting chemotaxis protein